MSFPFGNKKPFFEDRVYGFKGTFMGFEDEDVEPGNVKPLFKPLNSFSTREYPEEIPRENVETFTPENAGKNGVPEQVVVILENSNGESPYAGQVGEQLRTSLEELRNKLRDCRKELQTERERASEAVDSADRREDEDSTDNTRYRDRVFEGRY